MLKTTCATIALSALSISLANPALAARCASPAEAAALKTAVMQQELMVAALQCHEAGAYNRFVIAYRPELQDSDAALKAFFVRRGGEHGESGYDAFKTKAANLSALEQARDARAFCADAHVLFQAVLANRDSLISFVESRSDGTELGNVCRESRPTPLPVRAAEAGSVEVAPVPVAAAAVKIPSGPVNVAAARSVKVADVHPADDAVGGVPAYSEPASPYRDPDAAAPQPPDRDARDQDGEDQVQPATEQDEAPPPPHYYQIRSRTYDDYGNYAPPPPRAYSYGPPPGWSNYPPPGYGWYRRGGYYNW